MKLLYGTGNLAKLSAMRNRLEQLDIELIGLNDLKVEGKNVPEVKEDGNTPLENARLKAMVYYEAFQIPVFSCDSGLYFDNVPDEVQPGVHVRNVNGKCLSDDEMIDYYSGLVKAYGNLVARYRNAICFVMDNTHIYEAKAWDYAGERIGIGKAGYMVYKTLGMSIVASYEIWNEEFGDRYNQEELRKYTKEFLKNYYENNKVPLKQGLYVLLEYLKNANAKLAVASSSPRWEVEKHLNDAGIIDCFSAIICGDMVEKSKPAPDIYIKACEMLNENPEECIALEDSKNGLLSAYRAGCKPIMVPDLWQPDEEILQIIKGKYSDLEQVKKAFESGEI